MPSSKMSRPGVEEDQVNSLENFDFGEPEIIPVEISQGKYLYLKEPCAEDLINISDINSNEKISEIEATLQTICVLHYPQNDGKKLSLKDEKKLTARHLKKIGEALNTLLGGDEQ
jgi:hypothetical protein